MTMSGKVTGVRGSRIIETETLVAKGWPVTERGRHRSGRRGKVHVSEHLTRQRVLDFPGSEVVMAVLGLLAGIAVLVVGILLLCLLMLAVLQLIGVIVTL